MQEGEGVEQVSGETHLCEGLNSLLLLPAQPPALSCHLLPQRLELFLQDLDATLQGTPILVTQVAAWVPRPPSHVTRLLPHPFIYLRNWGERRDIKSLGPCFFFGSEDPEDIWDWWCGMIHRQTPKETQKCMENGEKGSEVESIDCF